MKHRPTLLPKAALSAALAVVAYLFFALGYRHHLLYHEQYQLLMLTGDYAMDLMREPGGVAAWLSRFLVQFFIFPSAGAAIMAALLLAVQLCSWLAMHSTRTELYPLSFLPAVAMWMALCDENGMPAACIALVLALLAGYGLSQIPNLRLRGIAMLCLTPAMYMAIGPFAVAMPLAAACKLPYALGGVAIAIACPIASQYVFPYHLERLCYGLHYYRFPQTAPVLAWCSTLAAALLTFTRYLNPSKRI